jgi:hypothetical protein
MEARAYYWFLVFGDNVIGSARESRKDFERTREIHLINTRKDQSADLQFIVGADLGETDLPSRPITPRFAPSRIRAYLGDNHPINESPLSVDLSRSSSAFRFDHYEILTREDGTPLEYPSN